MDSIGPYVFEAKLGAGGMGQVYRGRHKLLNIERAIKVLPPEMSYNREFRDRFLQEGQIAARLQHPNIVQVYDLGEDKEQLYLVMEYVPGESLGSLLKKTGPMPIDRVTHYLGQVAEALAYVHAQGIVHRDLKPANLMVRPDHTVQIVDFGIAKARDSVGLTQVGGIVGTMTYMAPERITKNATGPSIDQYALGVIAYEALLNKLPFDLTDTVSSMFKVAYEAPVIPAHVPPAIRTVLGRQLGKDPETRYPDSKSFLAALRAVSTASQPRSAPQAPQATTYFPLTGQHQAPARPPISGSFANPAPAQGPAPTRPPAPPPNPATVFDPRQSPAPNPATVFDPRQAPAPNPATRFDPRQAPSRTSVPNPETVFDPGRASHAGQPPISPPRDSRISAPNQFAPPPAKVPVTEHGQRILKILRQARANFPNGMTEFDMQQTDPGLKLRQLRQGIHELDSQRVIHIGEGNRISLLI